MRFVAALVIGLALPASATAEIVRATVLDAMPGHPDFTYLELLKQLAPDLAAAGDGTAAGHLAAPLRYTGDGGESAAAGDPVAIEDIAALPIRAEGEDMLLLLVDLGDDEGRAESFTMLALVGHAPVPVLLDAADVSYDRFTAFVDPPLLDLSSEDQAVLVRNTHSNSNQAYESTQMLFVKDHRLVEIGSVLAFSDWWCGFEHRQTASFEALPEPSHPYGAIRVSVLDQGLADGEACEDGTLPEPFERTVEATYRWDAAAGGFAPDSDALEKLAEDDEERF